MPARQGPHHGGMSLVRRPTGDVQQCAHGIEKTTVDTLPKKGRPQKNLLSDGKRLAGNILWFKLVTEEI